MIKRYICEECKIYVNIVYGYIGINKWLCQKCNEKRNKNS